MKLKYIDESAKHLDRPMSKLFYNPFASKALFKEVIKGGTILLVRKIFENFLLKRILGHSVNRQRKNPF